MDQVASLGPKTTIRSDPFSKDTYQFICISTFSELIHRRSGEMIPHTVVTLII